MDVKAKWIGLLGLTLLGACAAESNNTGMDGGRSDARADTSANPDGAVDARPDTGMRDATVAHPDTGMVAVPDAAGGCMSDDDCVAADLCTNARRCERGMCVAVGGVPSCDDNIACTNDSCNAAMGRCVHAPDNARCPMNQYCDNQFDCTGTPACETGSLSCARLPGDPCTGTWSCNQRTLQCQRSPGIVCDDHDACTTDRCMVTGTSYMCLAEIRPGLNYMNDPANCGACMNVCPSGTNQTAACTDGVCSLVCSPDYFDLNMSTADGCECHRTETVDQPDAPHGTTAGFHDTNCDGIDGTIGRAIFVSADGDDSNDGLTMAAPKRTVHAGVAAAGAMSPRLDVYVSQGMYREMTTLVIPSGVSVYGAYDSLHGWSRDISNTTTIASTASPAIRYQSVAADTTLQLFTVSAAAATTPGGSSYGMLIVNSAGNITIDSCSIGAGAGANGAPGVNGTNGGDGGGAGNASGSGGSGGGASSCAPGGRGGNGGSDANSGATGSNGTNYGPNPFGYGGMGGVGRDSNLLGCGNAGPGSPGSVGRDGSAGQNGMPADPADFTAAGYIPARGGDGQPPYSGSADGEGGGGGGGGGGRSSTSFIFSICNGGTGGGGGGGGGGGCGGTPGTGGGGGGASIGLFTVGSPNVIVTDSVISSALGGRGGAGGSGGAGGAAGSGGGGSGSSGSGAGSGGAGGPGGAGGQGGGGAGGPGGPSYAIAYSGDPPQAIRSMRQNAAGGAGGAGGMGPGGSAPNGVAGLGRPTYGF